MPGLSHGQVMRIVNRYIGVEGGYLGDFSYRTHSDFYTEYCDLDYNPNDLQGTTRERFIHIVTNAPPGHQAAILRGVVSRFPVGGGPNTRTEALRDEILRWASQLDGGSAVAAPTLETRSSAVETALADAEALISSTGAPNAVDRLHTAMHGYLGALCESEGIPVVPDANMVVLFKALRQHHPALQATGPQAGEITKILNSTAAILDALNPVRNRASGAHPNPVLLSPPEAMLVINLVRSLLHFVNARIARAR